MKPIKVTEESHTCWDCEKEFDFDWDETYTSCDTIEGQYTEFTAIRCPHCAVENRW